MIHLPFRGLHHLLRLNLNKELKEIYISLSLREWAVQLVGIFIPIYLYTLGFPLIDILVYYLMFHVFHLLSAFLVVGKLAKRFGVKHLMLFSMPFLFGFIVVAALLQFYKGIPLVLLSFLYGMANSLYWVGFNAEFAKFSDLKNRGREMSFMYIISYFFAACGPFIGGLLIVYFGYLVLYGVVLCMLILSVVPLFMSKDFSGKKQYKISKVFVKRSIRYDYLPHVVFGVTGAIFIFVWPLIIHLRGIFANVSGLGLLFTLTFIVGMFLAYYVGKLTDRVKNFINIAKISNVIFAILWVFRWLANTAGMLIGVEIVSGLNRSFANVPLDKYIYNRTAKSKDVVEYTVFREVSLHLFAALAILIIILVGDIFWSPFFAGAVHLLTLLI